MLRSYFTLYHIALELHERLAGGYLFEIYSQQKNEVMLAFVTPDGRHEQLVVTVRSPHFSLHTQEGLNRKRRNTAGLMKETYERQVLAVTVSPADRQISFELDDGHAIVLRMFSAETNVLLVRVGKIVETFKEGRKLENTPFGETSADVPFFTALETLANDPELFARTLEDTAIDDEPLDRRLLTALPGFDRKLVRRLLDMAEDDAPEQLHKAFVAIFYDLASPTPCVIERPGEPPRFSLFAPLDHAPFTPFENVLDAMNLYSRKMYSNLRQQEQAAAMRRELSATIGKIEKELASANKNDPEELAQQYETYGHLLTGAIGTTEPSGNSITVPNCFEPGSPDVTIPLKPRLNLQENAAWYFTQATKNRKRTEAQNLRHAELNRELDDLRQKLQALDHAIGSPESLRRLLETSGSAPAKSAAKQKEKHPFRAIPLGPNINLYIGKSAAKNEQLTFGFAKPNDIWLHARGASGSHCILKGAQMHNISEIERAAEIAAWHSSAKHSELVPVMYTEKKYVKKDRKSPGSVILEREKVVMVKPMKE